MSVVLCQKCENNPACIHRTDIIDGAKSTVHLCQGCAVEEGFAIDPSHLHAAATSLQEMLVPLVQSLAAGARVAGPVCEPCPACGLTWAEFRRRSRFGCPNDYLHFAPLLDPLLSGIHGSARHRGRVPASVQVLVEREQRLATLRKELTEAVSHERFERAATLRDAIASLETETRHVDRSQ